MKPAILQVVGYQNSGKTYFIEQIIKRTSKEGYKVGVIKHHGHGVPEVYDEKKDTGRHRHAGATITGVSGGGLLSIQATREEEWELDTLLSLYASFNLDFIVIEGYKKQAHPRVVMLRDKADEVLLENSSIRAVITHDSKLPDFTPSYYAKDLHGCITYLMEELKNGVL